MACGICDELEQRVMAAFRADASAIMADVNKRRAMSTAKYLQWKADTRRALKRAEDEQERHIAGCLVCQAEGRKAFRTSDIPD